MSPLRLQPIAAEFGANGDGSGNRSEEILPVVWQDNYSSRVQTYELAKTGEKMSTGKDEALAVKIFDDKYALAKVAAEQAASSIRRAIDARQHARIMRRHWRRSV